MKRYKRLTPSLLGNKFYYFFYSFLSISKLCPQKASDQAFMETINAEHIYVGIFMEN